MTTTHHHVAAVQDWGGSQQYGVIWDDKLDLTAARQLADDMINADRIFQQFGRPGLDAEFGDMKRWMDLISTNVVPGWEAVWVIPCDDHPCRFLEFKAGTTNMFGEPYWTASPAVESVQ